MMKNLFKNMIVLLAAIIAFSACNQTKETTGFLVKAEIEGIKKEGKITYSLKRGDTPIEVPYKDGKIEIKSEVTLKEPTNIYFSIASEDRLSFGLYVENGESFYKGKVESRTIEGYGEFKSIVPVEVKGSVVNDHISQIRAEESKIRGDMNFKEMSEDEINTLVEKQREELKTLHSNFIKEHPKSFYAAMLADRMAFGEDAAGVKAVLALLDPMNPYSGMANLKAKLAEMEKVDVRLEDVIKAENVTYKVDKSFNGKAHKDIVYLGVLSNNNVCGVTKAGKIEIVNSKGKELKNFSPKFAYAPTALAVDKKDNIYVLNPIQEEKEITYRGRKQKRLETIGFECTVFNAKGKKQNHYELAGVKTATGARIMDDKLLIADYMNRVIAVFDASTGEKVNAIEGMRPCCGILDFSINDKNEVLVANLGAFRVQAYDMTGKQLLAFGKRGKETKDFHGCCNPVSVAYLSNGAIVTVEKDPTTIKIFSKDGARIIEGVEELVKGCSYIPMIVDAKDNLYMASPDKGMIKCVSL